MTSNLTAGQCQGGALSTAQKCRIPSTLVTFGFRKGKEEIRNHRLWPLHRHPLFGVQELKKSVGILIPWLLASKLVLTTLDAHYSTLRPSKVHPSNIQRWFSVLQQPDSSRA